MGTREILARHIVETTYEFLPADVVRAAKDVILDGVGVMLPGSQEEPPRIVVEHAREMGGPPRCNGVLIETLETLPTLRGLIAVLAGGR